MIKLKRAYDEPTAGDGYRILVDRLWPRGLTKAKSRIDLWLKDVAPSTGLRRRFGHDPDKWERFEKEYWAELKERRDAVREIETKASLGTVTLIYAARDPEHNNAVALSKFIARDRA